jgi:hypothetical protein
MGYGPADPVCTLVGVRQRIDRSARIALIDGFAEHFGISVQQLGGALRSEEGLGDLMSIQDRIERDFGAEGKATFITAFAQEREVPSHRQQGGGFGIKAIDRNARIAVERITLLAVPDDWFLAAVEVGIEIAQNRIGQQAIDSLSSYADTGRVTRWVERVFEKNRCGCTVDDEGRIAWASSALTHRPLTTSDDWGEIDRDLVGLKARLARAHRANDFNGIGAQCDSILKRIGRITYTDAVKEAAGADIAGKAHAQLQLEHLVDAFGGGKTFAQVRKLSPGLFEAAYAQSQRAKHSLEATRADAILAVVLLDAVSEIARVLAARLPE